MNRCKVALIGVGGFGASHVAAAEMLAEDGLVRIVAFAEPRDEPEAVGDLQGGGARRYKDYREMLAQEEQLDVVCIATPISTHYPMAMTAFERGLHVFLEKPPAIRIQDLRSMVDLQEHKGVFCTVGYGDIARPSAIALKHRLCEGAIGKIKAINAENRWLRPRNYFTRSSWAGQTVLGNDFVLDGPLNNAASHVLNMAAYLAGSEPHEFAMPLWVQGELYRANDMAAEDTNCLRAEMDTGTVICFHSTLCASLNHPRSWTIIGEKGVARLDDTEGASIDGVPLVTVEREHPTTMLLRRLVEAIQGSDEPFFMPLADAESHLLMSNGAYESSGTIHAIPDKYIREETTHDGNVATVVDGMDRLMLDAAQEGKLLSECAVPWAMPTKPFDLSGYKDFPQRWHE
jgi:predicted dehydrogenase